MCKGEVNSVSQPGLASSEEKKTVSLTDALQRQLPPHSSYCVQWGPSLLRVSWMVPPLLPCTGVTYLGGDLNTQRIHSFICPLDRYLLSPSIYKQCTRVYFAMVSKTALVSWAHRASVVVLPRGDRAQEGEGSDIQWQPITGQGLDMHASAHLFFSTTLPFCRWGRRKGTYPRSQARFKPRDCLTSKPLLSSLNSHWDSHWETVFLSRPSMGSRNLKRPLWATSKYVLQLFHKRKTKITEYCLISGAWLHLEKGGERELFYRSTSARSTI